jgi:hypothetical protein
MSRYRRPNIVVNGAWTTYNGNGTAVGPEDANSVVDPAPLPDAVQNSLTSQGTPPFNTSLLANYAAAMGGADVTDTMFTNSANDWHTSRSEHIADGKFHSG